MSMTCKIAGKIAGFAVAALCSIWGLSPADAGSGANTRWYSNVNSNAVVVRDGGVFRVVDRETGYTLYDDGYCKKAAKSVDAALAKTWKSKAVYFCSRTDKRGDKWAWTESEFHLLSEQGRDIWRLFWVNESNDGKPVPFATKIKAAKIVPEYASYDKVLDGIACKVTFEKFGETAEYARVGSPYGDCAMGAVKAGKLPPGEFGCEPGVDQTFLAKRTVKLVNRGSATAPEYLLVVQGRGPKLCTVVQQ